MDYHNIVMSPVMGFTLMASKEVLLFHLVLLEVLKQTKLIFVSSFYYCCIFIGKTESLIIQIMVTAYLKISMVDVLLTKSKIFT